MLFRMWLHATDGCCRKTSWFTSFPALACYVLFLLLWPVRVHPSVADDGSAVLHLDPSVASSLIYCLCCLHHFLFAVILWCLSVSGFFLSSYITILILPMFLVAVLGYPYTWHIRIIVCTDLIFCLCDCIVYGNANGWKWFHCNRYRHSFRQWLIECAV